nr:hypothetical protein RVX_0581 [Nitratidesulfovibrio sp. HK-II]
MGGARARCSKWASRAGLAGLVSRAGRGWWPPEGPVEWGRGSVRSASSDRARVIP